MFSISADWETSNESMPEERACFAAIAINLGAFCLSEGHDPFVRRIRQAPYLSGFHLAEWLVWNWWRLRWEPRSQRADWPFAHRLATAGSGYVWPNLTIFSDGLRIAILAKPSRDQNGAGFRYTADIAGVLPAADFENAVDRFVEQIMGQLEAEQLRGNNLERLWGDLGRERADRSLARFRKIEALMGYDPDEAPPSEVERLITQEAELGTTAIAELAAQNGGNDASFIGADALSVLAEHQGTDAATRDAFSIAPRASDAWSQTPAWLVGQRLARTARSELGRRDEPIDDRRLASFLATDPRVLASEAAAPFSFILRRDARRERIVLRSRWRTSRRFELARLLGDFLSANAVEPLRPATRSQTYRQKMQRSFAAEFLSPFEVVDTMMARDYSEERQQDLAEHFGVSPLVIRTLLVNHRRLGLEGSETDVDFPAQDFAA